MHLRTMACALALAVACSDSQRTTVDGSASDSRTQDATAPPADSGVDLVPAPDATPGWSTLKLVFVVDCSGSMQFTDPSSQTREICLERCQSLGLELADCAQRCSGVGDPGRKAAPQQVVEHFAGNDAVQFAFVAFNSGVKVNAHQVQCPGFFAAPGPCVDAGLNSYYAAELMTDVQSALAAARGVLEQDIAQTTPDERLHTRYAVLLISDGLPEPSCQAGCDNDLLADGSPGWCEIPRDEWCAAYGVAGEQCNMMQQWFPQLTTPCMEYNTEAQVLSQVDEIIALGARHGLGQIRLHTAMLFDDSLPPEVLELFDPEPGSAVPLGERIEALLTKVAQAGQGVHRSYRFSQGIDLLSDFPLAL